MRNWTRKGLLFKYVTLSYTFNHLYRIFFDHPQLWDRKQRLWVLTHYNLEESDGEPDPVFESIYRPSESGSDSELWDE
jgi:hypothetical protein